MGTALVLLTSATTGGIIGNLSDSLLRQTSGHLTIQHRDYPNYFLTDPEKILIPDPSRLRVQLSENVHVRSMMPRVVMGGLLAKDERTTAFLGFASDVETLPAVLPDYGQNLIAGQLLSEKDPGGILVGQSLARSLGLFVGDEVVLLSKTVHGEESNALAHVRGILTFPSDPVLEQSLVFTSLGKPIREDLLDLGSAATRLVVRLDDAKNVPQVEKELARRFRLEGSPWRVIPWYDDRTFSQMVGMFSGLGRLIMLILAAMVGLVTSNSLLMSFFERIREIGTLRAIGMPTRQVYRLLYTEALIVGASGIGIGTVIGGAAVAVAHHVGIPIGGIVNQLVRPTLSVAGLALSIGAPLVCILVAAFLPIRSAVRMTVIDSLNHQ
jgi:putative ABC transport system permease protein